MKKLMAICAVCLVLVSSAQADLITNGGFETGDLTGWTVFTTVNGTVGAGMPDVVLFDTDDDSVASNSARFNVGRVDYYAGGRRGGGIYQNVNVTQPGTYQLQAYAAVLDNRGSSNQDGGLFESRPVEDEIGIEWSPGVVCSRPAFIEIAKTVEEVRAETGPLDRLQELLGDDQVGIDVGPIERGDNPGMGGKWVHNLSLVSLANRAFREKYHSRGLALALVLPIRLCGSFSQTLILL